MFSFVLIVYMNVWLKSIAVNWVQKCSNTETSEPLESIKSIAIIMSLSFFYVLLLKPWNYCSVKEFRNSLLVSIIV